MAEAVRTMAPSSLKLPKRLLDFFARYPPEVYSAKVTGVTIPITRKAAKDAAIARNAENSTAALGQASQTASAYAETSDELTPPTPTPQSSSAASSLPPNPFLPRKNFVTGKWAGAKIGLRRQAELVKLAKECQIEELLPPGRKSTAFKQTRLLERGLAVRGTGVGQKVKGHQWERHVGATLGKRRTAMENMPELINEWKRRGHGRGWKKYPK
ncbi:54S ribosomal protein L25, mitochondrial [Rhinocladiella similis]